jgi:hypothetical protein
VKLKCTKVSFLRIHCEFGHFHRYSVLMSLLQISEQCPGCRHASIFYVRDK